ncbi:MAG TPA: TIM-barrel domain-containing protein [Vicinamibacterales bacterium]|nr:TIM-barrel domain-containing protein [Vicinamibacterales bacterium]
MTRLCSVLAAGLAVLGLHVSAMSPAVRAAQGSASAAATTSPVERLADGVRLHIGESFLRLQVKSPTIVRVLFSKTRTPRVDDLVVLGPGTDALSPFPARTSTRPSTRTAAPTAWSLRSTPDAVTLTTSALRVTARLADGAVTFADTSGQTILAETPGAHVMTPATVQDEQTFHVQQRWRANDEESLYGLGQRQEGKLDLKGYDLDLWQRNMVVDIPFLVSSRGYGLLWDNTSPSKFGDTRPFVPIPAEDLVDLAGQNGGLSHGALAAGGEQIDSPQTAASIVLPPPARSGGAGAAPRATAWQGQVIAPESGDYQFQTYSNGGVHVWIDGQLRIDHWKQNWATEYDQTKIHFDGGTRHTIRVVSDGGADTMQLRWKTPAPDDDTSLSSEVGDAIDYDFVYGPSIDRVIAGYRTLTGGATMLPKWAFGFWQSKNKYNTQQEVLDTIAEFRRRGIPIDAIVQDWQYWAPDAWGSHEFEASRYPDPDAMIKTIHDQHAKFMISVWGKFYPDTANAKALAAIGALYQPTLTAGTRDWLNQPYTFYDVFNKPARKLFWNQINRALFSKGVDAWWMDATEPDIVQPSPPTLETLRADIDRTAIGTASRVMNAYALVNSEAVYDGQRSAAPDQRVFILTRSGFAGIQRYGTVTWSGDITSTWATLRKQITAGLNFSIAGDPYWTNDTGGYTMDNRFARARDGEALDEWQELNARWFQFSTFSPILRVHGADRPREMWNLGNETSAVYQAELKFDRLRYALFPYIYAIAGMTSHDGYTMMRPLVMDFRSDALARNVADEYMFGPAFLVSPVTSYKARSRQVYLPSGTAWFDFWTGRQTQGGRLITADAPYDQLPVFVRAGSIVPVGPDQQYIGETPSSSLTLYVYTGANGQFSLYEDDGLTYGYERGQLSRIPIAWNDGTRTLTLGARTGTFPGMLSSRTFNVIVVSADAPAGYQGAGVQGRTITYRGAAVSTRF